MEYKWHDWNLDHATRHGIGVEEIEAIIDFARPPYPENIGEGKWMVVSQGQGGRYVQVIYVVDDDGVVFVIHARPLDDREKRRFKRRRR